MILSLRDGTYFLVLLTACSNAASTAPQPAAPPLPTAGPTASAPAASASPVAPVMTTPAASASPVASTAPVGSGAPRADGRCALPPPPTPGNQLSPELLASLADVELPGIPGLSRASECAAALRTSTTAETVEQKKCSWDLAVPLLVGMNAQGQGAVLSTRERSTAGEHCPETWGEILDLTRSRGVSSRLLFKEGENCPAFERASNEFVAEAAGKGFVTPRNLLRKLASQPIGATSYRPLAVLDAPLCGWMLLVAEDSTRKKLAVTLLSPNGNQRHELGLFPLESTCVEFNDRGGCARKGPFGYPTVHEAVITPDSTRLHVSIAATPGGHNMPLRFFRETFLLPPEARPSP